MSLQKELKYFRVSYSNRHITGMVMAIDNLKKHEQQALQVFLDDMIQK
jgi:hypothetical protein